MDLLKFALTRPPALVSLDYTEGAGEIILAVDASSEEWGGVLMQLVKGKRYPSRYKSGIWSSAEKKYDATKRECRGILKALKKVSHWLYGVRFVLKDRLKSFGCMVKPIRHGLTWSSGYSMDSLDSVV